MPLLRCSSTHFGLPPNADDLVSVQFCCLAIVLPPPRFPSFRLGTAYFRYCLLLPPGSWTSVLLVVARVWWPQGACE